MRIIVLLFISMGFLSGCNATNSVAESEQSIKDAVFSPVGESVESLLTHSPFLSQNTEKENLLLFVPQQDERNCLREISHDPVLVELEKATLTRSFIKNTMPGQVTAHFSSVLFEENNKIYIALLLANRTEEIVTNEFIQISIRSTTNRVVKLHTTHLSPDNFGVLAPQTIMPLYMELSPTERSLFEEKELNNRFVLELYRKDSQSSKTPKEFNDQVL